MADQDRKLSSANDKPDKHYKHGKHRLERHERSLRGILMVDKIEPDIATRSQDPAFIIDKKGDFQNLEFGRPDRYKTSKFHAHGHGRLIGLDGRYRIANPLESSAARKVYDVSLDSARKGRETALQALTSLEDAEAIVADKIKYPNDEVTLQNDYITIGTKRKRVSDGRTEPQSDSEESEREGYNLTERYKKPVTKDSDGVKGYAAFSNQATEGQNLQFQRAISDDPQNADTWLALVYLQHDLFVSRIEEKRELSAKEKRTVSQIRIDIYESALSKITTGSKRERLILGYMREGAKIWDVSTQSEKWKTYIGKDTSFEIQVEYLNFLQSETQRFSVDRCLAEYLTCLRQVMQSVPPGIDRDYKLFYLTLRVTSLLKSSGFTERAIAIWQALLELNFLKPLHLSDDESVAAFQDFWDGEDLRIGEEGASGWNAGQTREPPTNRDHPVPQMDSDRHVLSKWSEFELKASNENKLPARTLDETSENDPFRVVFFSDIKDFLFRTSSAGSEILLQAFLQFFNLQPLLSSSLNQCRSWWADPFLTEYSPSPKARPGANFQTDPGPTPFSDCIPDTTSLFNLQATLPAVPKTDSDDRAKTVEFATRALIQVAVSLTHRTDKQLAELVAEYAVALELQAHPTKARKLVKSLLKKSPESLRLYNAYALVEHRLNNVEAAERAWSAALAMANTDQQGKDEKLLLWHSWMWQLLQEGYPEKAFRLLVMIPDGQADLEALQQEDTPAKLTAASRLRVKDFFSDQSERISTGPDYLRVLNIDIVNVFTCLMNDIDADRFLKSSNLATRYGESMSIILQEHMQQNWCRLIHYLTTVSPFHRPATIIQALRSSYQAFPQNTIIWSLYQYYKRKGGLLDRLRDDVTFESPTLANSEKEDKEYAVMPNNGAGCVISHLLAISNELNRPSYSGSTSHSIRAAFARGASSEDGSLLRHSPVFWEARLQWEIEQAEQLASPRMPKCDVDKQSGRKERSLTPVTVAAKHAVETFHAAVRACPWAKNLYVRALGSEVVRSALGKEGVKSVYDGMLERGIRVRWDVSEILEQSKV